MDIISNVYNNYVCCIKNILAYYYQLVCYICRLVNAQKIIHIIFIVHNGYAKCI